MDTSNHEEARRTCCTTTDNFLQQSGTSREGATIVLHPLKCCRQHLSKAIPFPQTHIARTDSELQLAEDKATADWRDLCMLYRMTNHICETQQSNLLPGYELLPRKDSEDTSKSEPTETNRMVRSRQIHSEGLLIDGTSYASSHLESSSNCASPHRESYFYEEVFREGDCINQEVHQNEDTNEKEWSVCAYKNELRFPALLVSSNVNVRGYNVNPMPVPGGEEEEHDDGCVFPLDL